MYYLTFMVEYIAARAEAPASASALTDDQSLVVATPAPEAEVIDGALWADEVAREAASDVWGTLRSHRPVVTAPTRRIEPRTPIQTRRETPTQRPMVAARPVGFNCPACSVVLVVREPHGYDGRPAPCPHCGVFILPPRIATAQSPFNFHPLPGLTSTSPASLSPRAPRAVSRPEKSGRMAMKSWEGGA
jgi:hypothetical protein